MINKDALYRDLIEAFIVYQYRLDNPMPTPNETMEAMIHKYQSDPTFHAKVKHVVSGVMHIVGKHERKETSHDSQKLLP